jgi:hypothetical protein
MSCLMYVLLMGLCIALCRDELKTTFTTAVTDAEATPTLDKYVAAMNALLDLIYCDLVNVRMNKAFETANSEQSMAVFTTLKQLVDDSSKNTTADTETDTADTQEAADVISEAKRGLSSHLDIRGQQHNLHCNYTAALSLYQQAVEVWPDNFETKLRIGQILVDVGKDTEVTLLSFSLGNLLFSWNVSCVCVCMCVCACLCVSGYRFV